MAVSWCWFLVPAGYTASDIKTRFSHVHNTIQTLDSQLAYVSVVMYNFCENEIYDEIAYQVDNVSMGSRTGLHSAIILAVRIVSGTTFTRNQ